ncbi:ferritin-like metal-binding protein YciE [Luteibacter sp. Sphag1AF]|nr:ferritin-like metal-binding protein YciE [Luteibacter sp. Sphag1AF]
MTIKTIEDLFIHEFSDIYSAEKQLTKALPRLARASTDPGLKEEFESHLGVRSNALTKWWNCWAFA